MIDRFSVVLKGIEVFATEPNYGDALVADVLIDAHTNVQALSKR
jgi:hypothetical protein